MATERAPTAAELIDSFVRRSPIARCLPIFRSAQGAYLRFTSPWSGRERTVLDLNQNAGCAIFGHSPPDAVGALHACLAARTPMRLPLARCEAAEELSDVLLRNSGLGPEFQAVLGLHSGAEAIDQALALALCAPRPGGALHPAPTGSGPPLMLVLLEGSFHGNCTRAAFSASAVFRAHPRREALCDFEAAYLAPDASAAQVEAAFARHDAGEAAVVAVVLEAQQHFARFAALQPRTAAALQAAAARRGVPVVLDEIWSGVYRTGPFLALTAQAGEATEEAAAAEAAGTAPPPPLLLPSAVVVAKGLSVGLCKHAALLVRDDLLPPAAAAPRPAAPCALACSAALACLAAAPPAAVAAKARRLERRVRELAAARAATLLPVAGRGFSYEFELRATSELQPEWCAVRACDMHATCTPHARPMHTTCTHQVRLPRGNHLPAAPALVARRLPAAAAAAPPPPLPRRAQPRGGRGAAAPPLRRARRHRAPRRHPRRPPRASRLRRPPLCHPPPRTRRPCRTARRAACSAARWATRSATHRAACDSPCCRTACCVAGGAAARRLAPP